jgi:hypothetical protein
MKTADITPDTLARITLHRGHGQNPPNGNPVEETEGCVIDWASWLHRKVWKDSDPSISPVIQRFCITLNDRWDDEARQRLVPYIPRVLGTASTNRDVDRRRGWLAADWAIRTAAPAWLRVAGKNDLAATLEALEEIRTAKQARTARDLIDPEHKATWYGWRSAFYAEFKPRFEAELKKRGLAVAVAVAVADAAVAVADAAVAAAAVADAAAAVADAAAADADAVADAVAAAAPTIRRSVIYDAVYKALTERRSGKFRETVQALQVSSLDLLDRMIAVTEEDVAA